jgi:CubicO group peptidase (beta-lactamase class C family)
MTSRFTKWALLLILCIALLLPGMPALASVQAPNAEDLVVQQHIAQNQDQIAGLAIMRLTAGEQTLEQYYGYADVEQHIPVDEETVFEWGSITKLFVWTSVMQQVERGTLELDTDIRTYLPDGFLKPLQYDAPLTLTELMTHTAGFAERNDVLFFDPSEMEELGDALLTLGQPAQIYAPGTVVAYSSYGTALAAYIVECVSGKPFYEYARTEIFTPAAMNDTTLHPTAEERPDLAARRDRVKGYDQNRTSMQNERSYISIYPAGSALGTTGDLVKFARALTPPLGENSPLFARRATLEQMLSPLRTYPDGTPLNSHGFWAETRAGTDYLMHAGNTAAFTGTIRFDPLSRDVLVVLSNTAQDIANHYILADRLLGSLGSDVALLTPGQDANVPTFGSDPALPTLAQDDAIRAQDNAAATTDTTTDTVFDPADIAGTYHSAAWQTGTFTDMRTLFPTFVTLTDDPQVIRVGGLLDEGLAYQRVAPYVYRYAGSDDVPSAMLYFNVQDGEVVAINSITEDLLRVSFAPFVVKYILLGLLILSGVYGIILLLSSLLHKLIKQPQVSRLRRIRNLGGAYLVLVIAALAIMLISVLSNGFMGYSVYRSYLITLGLSVPACVIYLVFMFLELKRHRYSAGQITLATTTGACLLMAAVAVVVLNLWH